MSRTSSSPPFFARLARYILRESIWLYIFGVVAFWLLLSIDFLSQWAQWFIDQLADYSMPERFRIIGQLMLYKLPWMMHLALPISVVFAILLSTGRLAKDSELKAAYSLGVPPLRLLAPLIIFGMVISFLIVANNGYFEPWGKVREEITVTSFYRNSPPVETQRDVAYALPLDEAQPEVLSIFYAGRILSESEDRDSARLDGVFIRHPDGTRITASHGAWDSQQSLWILEYAHVIDAEGVMEQVGQLSVPFNYEEDIFTSLADTEKLSLTDLWRRYRLAVTSGANSQEAAFEFHRRLADAFSAAIFALIAAAIGLGLKQRSIGFAWTIVLLVVFYFLWTLSGDLFERNVLSGEMAAWLTASIIGSIGLVIAYVRLR